MDQENEWAPPVSFYFKVEFQGGPPLSASFQEVSGLKLEMEVEERREGGANGAVYHLPVKFKHGNLILKRALEPLSDGLEKWINDTMDGQFIKKIVPVDISVSLLGADSVPLAKWTCTHAYPVKWDMGVFNSQTNGLVIETLELCYNELRRDKV